MRKVLAIIFCAVLLLNTIGCGNKYGINTQVKEDTNFELINTEIGKKLSLKSYQNVKNVLNSKDKQKKYDFENDYIKILKVLDLEVEGNVFGILNGYGGPIKIKSIGPSGEGTRIRVYWISKEGNIIPEWSYPNPFQGTIFKGRYKIEPIEDIYYKGKRQYGIFDLDGKCVLNAEYGIQFSYGDG